MLWNDRLKTYNGKDIKYDLEGNPVSYDGKSYVWNGKQLTEIKAADGSYTQYNYDASGLRTQKKQYKSDGTLEYSVDYIWKDGKISVQNMVYNIEQEKDGVVTYKPITFTSKFVYFNNENTPSAIILNGQTMLLKKNIQGDVTSIIEPSGETMISFSYDPWGNITYIADESLDETAKAIITAICPVTYRGYNYDFTTGLYYLQSRYYNPEWGRFLNADDTSILLSSVGSPLGANMYAYCNNNPINKIDYNGMLPKVILRNLDKILFAAAFLSEMYRHGVGYVFDDNMDNYYDFNYHIDKYGLVYGVFVFKKSNNNYMIVRMIFGSSSSWKLYNNNYTIMDATSKKNFDDSLNRYGADYWELNKNIPDDVQLTSVYRLVSAGLVGISRGGDIVRSYGNATYYHPLDGYANYWNNNIGMFVLYNFGQRYKYSRMKQILSFLIKDKINPEEIKMAWGI